MVLSENSKVHIVGGGPAGSFFAIHLLRQAQKAAKSIKVHIIDKRIGVVPARHAWQLTGCNCCAGVISPQLHRELKNLEFQIPGEVICTSFTHVWLHGLWKNFPLKVPMEQTLCSVFRGSLPQDRDAGYQGFDAFLLNQAAALGATLIPGTIRSIRYSDAGSPVLHLDDSSGQIQVIESDFVCISTGVNASPGKTDHDLFTAFKKINPAFRPPATRPTLVVEMKPGRDYLKKYLNRELYLVVSGSKQLHLEHVALVPKQDHLTLAFVGKSIDTTPFPDGARGILKTFFSLPQIRSILPGMRLDTTPVSCMCNPLMAVGLSKEPFADRIALIGDALGARLYRDGLYSAFISAATLAKTAMHKGVDQGTLTRGFDETMTWLEKDNKNCRVVFSSIQTILKSNLLSRIFYQTFASEMKFKPQDTWPLGKILWQIGSGSADYSAVIKDLINAKVFRSILTGIFKTFRNILTERFFGIKWGIFGRYPTVILREKRSAIKRSIQAPLEITLADWPQMERMYAIKIRASAAAIFEELGKFGQPDSKFLQLRFVDVKRMQGQPNQTGSVVRYSLRRFPVSMDIRLVRAVENKSLMYVPQELFTQNGILLFDITPTNDGNNRLVVYTAFDYKKGTTLFGKLFFKVFRRLFPDYAHDVVWNHAVCTIKYQAEQHNGSVNEK